MDKLVEALKTHLLDAVRAIAQPRMLVQEVLARDSKISDSLFIYLQLVLAAIAAVAPKLPDLSSATLAAPFIFFLHLTILTVLVKALTKPTKVAVEFDKAFSFSLICLGTVVFVGSVGYLISMASLKLLQPEHHHWLTNNPLSNAFYYAVNDPDKLRPLSQGKGWALFSYLTYATLALVFVYWMVQWTALVSTSDSSRTIRLLSGAICFAVFFCVAVMLSIAAA